MIDGLKPYGEYRESGVTWLGKIPSHWTIGPGFAAFRENQTKNKGLIENQVLSLSYGRIVIKSMDKLHGLVPDNFETYQIVEPGDIIIRPTDLQNDKTSLRVGMVRDRGIITSAYICMRPVGKMTSAFGHQVLLALDLMKVFYGLGSGLRQNLSFLDFKRLSIFVPPPDEQSAIVRFLDHANQRIDRFIRTKKKVIALLNEQKQAIIHRAVTRGIDPDVKLKDSGIPWLGEIPEHWEIWRISRFAKVGNGSTPSRAKPNYWNGGTYPWLNSSHVNRGHINSADQFVTKLALRECHLPQVPLGSVLIAITGQGKTRGTSAVLEVEATINQHIAYITPKTAIVVSEFLHLALTASYRTLRSLSDDSGSTKGALTCADIKSFKVAVPKTAEQISIIRQIEKESRTVTTTIKRTERELEVVLEYRTRLIADVVTGKVDVREAARNLPVTSEDIPLEPDTEDLDEESELEPESTEAAA